MCVLGWMLAVLLTLSVSAFTISAAEPVKFVFPPHPRLAISASELAAQRQGDNFPAVRDAAVKRAQPLLDSPLELPQGFGSWVFYYACPDDGATLKALSPTEHQCPRCMKKYNDERTIAAHRCQMHYALERGALRLGWAYAYANDDRYAAQARRILLHLADAYDYYPARQDRWGRTGWFAPLGGRRYVQSLDEAVGVIRLAKAYDLCRDSSVWTDADRQHVENDFFRATAKTLLVFNQGINNHQTWYNAGLMAIGSVLGDEELINKVLSMRGGFRDQLQRSLGDDGLWYEGAMAYQNYALQAMVEIVDAGRRLGLQLEEEPRFILLLGSSLKATYPNGMYPAINDSDPVSFRSFGWSYDWAWKTYGDLKFAQAAAWGNPAKLKRLLGEEATPQWPLETKSINLPDAGLAVLRAGEGADQACVFFDYGQHGGGHGHFDKLNITLFANRREWLLDTGRIGYTHKEYKTWVKHTVAHNTVVIDQKDQWASTGRLLWLETNDEWSAVAAECKHANTGVMLRRWLWLSPNMLVDVYDVSCDKPATIDWLAHAVTQPIQPVGNITGKPAKLGDGPGYAHLTEGISWPVRKASAWDFPAGKLRLRLWAADTADETFTAVGIGANPQQKAPAFLRRVQGDHARFVTVYDLSGDAGYVQSAAITPAAAATVAITTMQGRVQVEFTEQGVSSSPFAPRK